MAKPGLLNIDTTNTFQNWLDSTNQLVDIMKSEAITASVTGDTTGSSGNPLDATLFGSFTANNVTASDSLITDSITPTSGSSEIGFDSPINIQTSSVVTAKFDSTNGARTRYTGPNVNWDVGILSNATNSFTIDAAGVAGISLELTTSGDLEIARNFIGGLNIPNGKVLDASSADDVLLPPNFGLVPTGGIIMWSGIISSIPSGWALCDGTNGTPDLIDRFVVGAGSNYSVGDSGGENSVTLTEAQMPSHTHSINGSTTSAGDHTHYTLRNGSAGTYSHAGDAPTARRVGIGGSENYQLASFSPSDEADIGLTNSSGAHNHTLSATAAAVGGGSAHENRPPYYALAYIMKL